MTTAVTGVKFQEALRAEARNLRLQVQIRFFVDSMCGWFYSSGRQLQAVALGAAPDWTTMLCEGAVLPDHGLADAIGVEKRKLARVALDLIHEWDVFDAVYDMIGEFDD